MCTYLLFSCLYGDAKQIELQIVRRPLEFQFLRLGFWRIAMIGTETAIPVATMARTVPIGGKYQ